MQGLPSFNGRRIGLYGGSFNPAHDGHLSVSHAARVRLALDEVWWLVSPQNPLKAPDETADLHDRMAEARAVVRGSRIKVLDIERRLNSRTTAGTLAKLAPVLGQGRFVWLMGADSFAELHLWHDWRQIPARIPLAVFDRPGFTRMALVSPAARVLAHQRIAEAEAQLLCDLAPPAWGFFRKPLHPGSSRAIRARRQAGVST